MSIFKGTIIVDMPFPDEKAYNPPVSKTPILGPSSGNPASFQDPNSVASVGNTIQAMTDQANADTLYDTPPPKKEGFREPSEGFRNEIYSPWILRTESCSKEGFSAVQYNPSSYTPPSNNLGTLFLVILGAAAIFLSFSKKK